MKKNRHENRVVNPCPLSPNTIIAQASEVLKIESEGILNLIPHINHQFVEMVNSICQSSGRVIVSGIGKSGIVGRKIVATLNSTGTRSLFLHPVEAMHGDLGMVSQEDIFLALSSSGETDELNLLAPSIRKIGCKTIAFTGNVHSTLAVNSDIVIDVGVSREACPLGLAPTASSTALLAMGDALAVVLINQKKFKLSDFRRFHPGGNLGLRLASRVQDIMLTGDMVPRIALGSTLEQAIREINRLELGATLITGPCDTLAGILTDGDIRRLLARHTDIYAISVDRAMTPSPRSVTLDSQACDALNLMEKHQITILPILNHENRIQGILHLHDILGKGEFKFNGKHEI